jgi:hypothetical protein
MTIERRGIQTMKSIERVNHSTFFYSKFFFGFFAVREIDGHLEVDRRTYVRDDIVEMNRSKTSRNIKEDVRRTNYNKRKQKVMRRELERERHTDTERVRER